MADKAPRTLLCLIEGDSSPFTVTLGGGMYISNLKDLIKQAGITAERPVHARDLTLWKVRMTMASDRTTNSPAG